MGWFDKLLTKIVLSVKPPKPSDNPAHYLAPERKARVQQIQRQLKRISVIKDPNVAMPLMSELREIYREALPEIERQNKKIATVLRMQTDDTYGLKPAGARLWNLFEDSPFAIYAYVARQFWPVRACLSLITDEIENDGVELIGQKGTTRKRYKEVYRKLKDLRIFELRKQVARHLKLYGNAWILPHKNLLGTPGMLEILAPPRVTSIIDPYTDNIIGWRYEYGKGVINYRLEDVYHLMDISIDDYKPLGDPSLSCAILAIEAALAASSTYNNMFQNGAMMGLIINMQPDTQDPLAQDPEDAAEDLQDRIESQFSSFKNANKVCVTSGVDKVHDVSPVGKFDQSYSIIHKDAAKVVCGCFGVPSEKIGVSRSDTLQYIPGVVEDSVNVLFNKTMNSLMNKTDNFINDYVLREMLGITDVRIKGSGRYGALTKQAAETIKILSEAGPILTVNWALERVLGWEPLPPDNPRGNLVLDNSANRDVESNPLGSDPYIEDPNFGKGQKKVVSSILPYQFMKYCMSGWFEGLELPGDADDDLPSMAIIKKGHLTFYGYAA